MNDIKNFGLNGSASLLLFCLAFFVSICLFFNPPTFASETIEFKLAWDANTEADLDGYEIYFRDRVSGSGYKMISDVYVDELVDPDNPMVTITIELSDNSKYYFAITAFDTKRNTSDFSEKVCAEITGSTVTECRVDEIIGTWSSGIWYWDMAASKWTKMTSQTTDGDIAAGDFTGDGKADVASIWKSGLWYQDGATLAWTKIPGNPPNRVTAGDVTGDGRSEIIGTWSSGIWYWDMAASKWTKMTSQTTDGDIAAGDFTGDGKADVASIWKSGLWYQDGATLAWTKIPGNPPNSVTAGDVTGDGRSEIIGTWSSGIWYWDVAASKWTKMTSQTTDGDIAAGDFTGDGKADVASIWPSGLWYQDGANLAWTQVLGAAPDSVTTGDVTGK